MLPTWLELRIALRTLRRSKAFATFSILALALAIAANTTMSSLIDGLVCPEVAFPEPGQLYVAHFTAPRTGLYTARGIHEVLGDSGRTYSGATSWLDDAPYSSTITVEQRDCTCRRSRWPEATSGSSAPVRRRERCSAIPRPADRHEAVISERLWRRISAARGRSRPSRSRYPAERSVPDGTQTLTVIGVIADNGAIPANTDLFMAVPFHRAARCCCDSATAYRRRRR